MREIPLYSQLLNSDLSIKWKGFVSAVVVVSAAAVVVVLTAVVAASAAVVAGASVTEETERENTYKSISIL